MCVCIILDGSVASWMGAKKKRMEINPKRKMIVCLTKTEKNEWKELGLLFEILFDQKK